MFENPGNMAKKTKLGPVTENIFLDSKTRVVRIIDLTVENEELFDLLKDKSQQAEWVRRILQVGTIGMKNMLVGYNVDYVDRRFQELMVNVEKQFNTEKKELQDKIDETFDIKKSTSSVGILYNRINELFDPKNKQSVIALMDERIDKMFNEKNKDSAISRLTSLLEKYFDDKKGIVKTLVDNTFNPDRKDSPIAKLKKDLEDYFGETGSLAKQLDERFNIDDKTTPMGKLSLQLDSIFDEDRGKVKVLLDSAFNINDKKSAMSHFSKLLEDNFDVESGNVKKLLDPNREGSPIHQFKKDILADLLKIKEKIIADEAAAKERQHGTAKGQDFEDIVEAVLQRVAQSQSDEVACLGAKGGIHGKKGDFVIKINQDEQHKISIEAKDRYIGGAGKVFEELDAGMKNRGAKYGILVFKTEDLMPEELRPAKIMRDRMIVSMENCGLYFAYYIGRFFVEKNMNGNTSEIQCDKIQTELHKVLEMSRLIDDIESQGGKITKAGTKVAEDAAKLRAKLETSVEKIKVLVTV